MPNVTMLSAFATDSIVSFSDNKFGSQDGVASFSSALASSSSVAGAELDLVPV